METGVQCIGVCPYKFKPNDQEQEISGYTVWMAESRDGVFGLLPFKVSFSEVKFVRLLENLGVCSPSDLIGRYYDLSYNRYGRVETMFFVD